MVYQSVSIYLSYGVRLLREIIVFEIVRSNRDKDRLTLDDIAKKSGLSPHAVKKTVYILDDGRDRKDTGRHLIKFVYQHGISSREKVILLTPRGKRLAARLELNENHPPSKKV